MIIFKGQIPMFEKKPKIIGSLHNQVYMDCDFFFLGMVRQSASGYSNAGLKARLALLDGSLELPLRRCPRRRHDQVLPH